ncbi:MAG: hypothetical protein JWL62_2397, partial [Hyphomicrobiales bacterium]|nr:hypothetical protein [Hyphomicrobiales bacterium]
ADGMKTGFVCASGFNVVASAQRGGRHLVVVVLGSPNAKARTIKAANLFDAGFGASSSWHPTQLTSLPFIPGPAPNLRADICGRHKKVVQEDDLAVVLPNQSHAAPDSAAAFFANDGRPNQGRQALLGPRPTFEPIDVFVGRTPGWTGPVAQARATIPTKAMVPASAAAFADPNQRLQPGIPPVSASALPLGLLGASRGIGATATRAIAVKSATSTKPAPHVEAKTPVKPKVAAKAVPAKAEAAKPATKTPAAAKKAVESKAASKKPAPVKVTTTKAKAE